MAQFLPLRCWDFCAYQLHEINRFQEAHSAPESIGWTKMYDIPAAPAPIVDLAISDSDLAAAMPWQLRRTNCVLSGGWSSDGTRQKNMAAYTAGSCAIVFSCNQDRIIDSLWFHSGYVSRWYLNPLLATFLRIGVLRPMLLVDWRGVLLDLSDGEAMRNYLRTFGSSPADRSYESSDLEKSAKETKPSSPPPQREESLFRFDCAVYLALVAQKCVSGPRQAVLAGPRGQSWSLSVNSTSTHADADVAPLPFRLRDADMVADWVDIVGDRILILRDYDDREQYEVCDIRDGGIIYSSAEADLAVMTPDGNSLLILTDDGIVIAELTRPTTPVLRSGLFTVFGIDPNDTTADLSARLDWPLDNPGSMQTVVTGAKTFTLAIGDYGFAVAAEVRLGGTAEPPLVITQPARSFTDGLMYDPVEIVCIVPGENIVVRHGYGCGLTCFNLNTGLRTACPLPAGNTGTSYGIFHRAVAFGGSTGFWVQTNVGPHLWDGAGRLERVTDQASTVIATDGERYLGVSPDGWDLIRGRF